MLALEGIHVKAQLSSKVLDSSWHQTDKNQMAYDACLYYIQVDVGCQAKQGVFSVIKSDEWFLFISFCYSIFCFGGNENMLFGQYYTDYRGNCFPLFLVFLRRNS